MDGRTEKATYRGTSSALPKKQRIFEPHQNYLVVVKKECIIVLAFTTLFWPPTVTVVWMVYKFPDGSKEEGS